MTGSAPVLLPAQTAPVLPKPSAAVPVPSSLPANQATERSEEPGAREATEQRSAVGFKVDFGSGDVAVDATNASLNQVVREVARKAGIKVTGSVADERVFGHYGPSSPSVVLAALLDGTGSNMLLVSDARGSSELILTPRRGTVTPPASNAAAEQAAEPDEPEENAVPQYVPPSRTFQPPTRTGRGPVNSNPDGSPVTEPDAAPAPEAQEEPSEDTQAQPNGQKTPQQIYEQLQKMMQQRQTNTQTPPAPESQD